MGASYWESKRNSCRNMSHDDGEIPAKRFKADEPADGSGETRAEESASDVVNREWMKRLQQILSCPVCYETIRPNVDICRNGHSVCAECRTRVTYCPLCTAMFMQTTNIMLSQISEYLKYSCPNALAGCKEMYYLRDEDAHLTQCTYLAHRCKIGSCCWSGTREELRTHVENSHGEDVWMKKWCFSGYGEFKSTETDKFGKFLVIENDLFWMLSSYEPSQQKLYKTFQHVGSKDDSRKFAYQICLKSPDERSRFSYESVMDDDSRNWSKAFDSPNSAVIDFGVLQAFSSCSLNLRLKYDYFIFKLK